MDDTVKLLAEIRDLLQRQLELSTVESRRAATSDAERKVMNEQMLVSHRGGMHLYRRVVVAGSLVILALVLVLLLWLVSSWPSGQ